MLEGGYPKMSMNVDFLYAHRLSQQWVPEDLKIRKFGDVDYG